MNTAFTYGKNIQYEELDNPDYRKNVLYEVTKQVSKQKRFDQPEVYQKNCTIHKHKTVILPSKHINIKTVLDKL